ncbi:hypothetical protein PF007_g6353 [Phytophthora fragariae]|uniref:Uncharacterized protein n=1 Tax=Phytophthora fragariae TaxID=53985 RepID=A0A6A3SXP7_9STRA|nr:hypothetical protein PF009_g6887 [Phytophthora fragariae]KAE9125433.1 hypothetical protein PF007_g6353 [Phytophthora fragariae]KAE9150046.1 hypothetical protein PF006_g5539 [Phytophthora fragariae]
MVEAFRQLGTTTKKRSLRTTALGREKQYIVQTKTKTRSITKWQIFNIVRRLVVIAAAILYIYISVMATWRMTEVLRDMTNPTQSFGVFASSLIGGYVGDGLIRDSPLVQDVLGGDTTPRDYVLFLESETKTSVDNCSDVPLFTSNIYNYGFLTHGYMEIVNDTSYNISILNDLELVVIVVDCTFSPLTKGDRSSVRVFNIMRARDDPSDLYLLMSSMSAQDYEVRAHSKFGPALLGMLTVIHDMREANLQQFYLVSPTYPYQRSLDFELYEFLGVTDGYLELRSIPQDPLTQPVKNVLATRKRGFSNGNIQSNVNRMYTLLDSEDAMTALIKWEWFGEATTTDSWAWVHGLHFFYAIQTIFSLIVLCIISYHNLRAGKIWIGDPFASVSTATFVGRVLSGNEIVYIHKELVYADVLVVYLGIVGLMSSAIRERIDPGVAIFMFEIIHIFRFSLLHASSVVLNEVVAYSNKLYLLGDESVPDAVYAMSPMDYWSAFQIPEMNFLFISASFFPRMILLVTLTGYAVLRKIYWHYYPEEVHHLSGYTAERSVNENAAIAQKGHLTNFEISTGAELQTRFGIISDYKNYVHFKGMKFASADGVYCSGYVIVNGKFLVSSKDLLAIAMIKLIYTRFTVVFVYEVEGNTVKDTARLVDPETFTWTDLWQLNVSVLL